MGDTVLIPIKLVQSLPPNVLELVTDFRMAHGMHIDQATYTGKNGSHLVMHAAERKDINDRGKFWVQKNENGQSPPDVKNSVSATEEVQESQTMELVATQRSRSIFDDMLSTPNQLVPRDRPVSYEPAPIPREGRGGNVARALSTRQWFSTQIVYASVAVFGVMLMMKSGNGVTETYADSVLNNANLANAAFFDRALYLVLATTSLVFSWWLIRALVKTVGKYGEAVYTSDENNSKRSFDITVGQLVANTPQLLKADLGTFGSTFYRYVMRLAKPGVPLTEVAYAIYFACSLLVDAWFCLCMWDLLTSTRKSLTGIDLDLMPGGNSRTVGPAISWAQYGLGYIWSMMFGGGRGHNDAYNPNLDASSSQPYGGRTFTDPY